MLSFLENLTNLPQNKGLLNYCGKVNPYSDEFLNQFIFINDEFTYLFYDNSRFFNSFSNESIISKSINCPIDTKIGYKLDIIPSTNEPFANGLSFTPTVKIEPSLDIILKEIEKHNLAIVDDEDELHTGKMKRFNSW